VESVLVLCFGFGEFFLFFSASSLPLLFSILSFFLYLLSTLLSVSSFLLFSFSTGLLRNGDDDPVLATECATSTERLPLRPTDSDGSGFWSHGAQASLDIRPS